MLKKKNEIEEFVSESIEQIRSAPPKDCILTSNIDFDISLVSIIEKEGRIGIHLAGLGGSSKTQQVHRVRFSITDKKSLKSNIQLIKKMIRNIIPEFSKLEKLE
jgi:hypothetical protein